MTDTREQQTRVILPQDEYELCRRAAKIDRRSYSQWARGILVEAAKEAIAAEETDTAAAAG